MEARQLISPVLKSKGKGGRKVKYTEPYRYVSIRMTNAETKMIEDIRHNLRVRLGKNTLSLVDTVSFCVTMAHAKLIGGDDHGDTTAAAHEVPHPLQADE